MAAYGLALAQQLAAARDRSARDWLTDARSRADATARYAGLVPTACPRDALTLGYERLWTFDPCRMRRDGAITELVPAGFRAFVRRVRRADNGCSHPTLLAIVPSWQRAAFASCVIAAGRLSSSGLEAATPTPDQVGQWSAPVTWPLVAVHMSLEPNGKVLSWDGWDDAPNSSGSGTRPRTFVGVLRAQPVLRRSVAARGRADADRRRQHRRRRRPRRHDDLRSDRRTRTSAARTCRVGRWYPTATELADGRVLVFSGDNIVQDRPGSRTPFKDASVNSLPEIYNPKTNTGPT